MIYTKEELAKERKSVFGDTNGDLKRGLEFGVNEYKEIDRYCKEKGIEVRRRILDRRGNEVDVYYKAVLVAMDVPADVAIIKILDLEGDNAEEYNFTKEELLEDLNNSLGTDVTELLLNDGLDFILVV